MHSAELQLLAAIGLVQTKSTKVIYDRLCHALHSWPTLGIKSKLSESRVTSDDPVTAWAFQLSSTD